MLSNLPSHHFLFNEFTENASSGNAAPTHAALHTPPFCFESLPSLPSSSSSSSSSPPSVPPPPYPSRSFYSSNYRYYYNNCYYYSAPFKPDLSKSITSYFMGTSASLSAIFLAAVIDHLFSMVRQQCATARIMPSLPPSYSSSYTYTSNAFKIFTYTLPSVSTLNVVGALILSISGFGSLSAARWDGWRTWGGAVALPLSLLSTSGRW